MEIVRRGFDRFLTSDLDGWLETIDPGFGWDTSAHPLPDVPDRGQGRDAWVTHLRTYMSGWNGYSAEVKEIFEAGDAEVVVVLHETATMRDSGVPLERDLVHLWTVRDGRGAYLRVFKTKAEALEAAGLEE